MSRLGRCVGHLSLGNSFVRRGLGRAAVATAALLLATLADMPPAGAALAARTTPTTTASSGKWAVTPTATTVTTVPNCTTNPSLCVAFAATGVGNPWRAYFNVWNTGTETLKGLSYVLSFTGGAGPTVALASCSVPWNTTNNTCTGTRTTVLAASPAGTYAVTVAVPAAVGAVSYLRASVHNNPTGITISTTVASSQVTTWTTSA